MHVIITCKYEKDRIKTAEQKWQHQLGIQTCLKLETSLLSELNISIHESPKAGSQTNFEIPDQILRNLGVNDVYQSNKFRTIVCNIEAQ